MERMSGLAGLVERLGGRLAPRRAARIAAARECLAYCRRTPAMARRIQQLVERAHDRFCSYCTRMKAIATSRYGGPEVLSLQEGEDGGILTVDPGVEQGQKDAIAEWRSSRDEAAVGAALDALSAAARDRELRAA